MDTCQDRPWQDKDILTVYKREREREIKRSKHLQRNGMSVYFRLVTGPE